VPISKFDGVAADAIAKIDGVAMNSLAKVSGVDAAPEEVTWLIWANDRILWSTASYPIAEDDWSKYAITDMADDAHAIAYGKDSAGNDRWIGITTNGANGVHVASSSLPTLGGHWTRVDHREFGNKGNYSGNDWGGDTIQDVLWTNAVTAGTASSGMWVIVGDDGGIAMSTTGSSNTADWHCAEQKGLFDPAGTAATWDINAATVSGTTLWTAGQNGVFSTGTLPSNWGIITNNTTQITMSAHMRTAGANTTDCDGLASHNLGTLKYRGERFMFIGDSSNKSDDIPYFATGSGLSQPTYRNGGSVVDCWRNEWTASKGNAWNSTGSSISAGAGAFNFDAGGDAFNAEWQYLESDGLNTWVLVGQKGKCFVSIDKGNSFTGIVLPEHAADGSGVSDDDQAAGGDIDNVDLYTVFYYNDMWLVGGEDGYLAYSTASAADLQAGANWHFIPNKLYQNADGLNDGFGSNRHVKSIAVNKPNTGQNYST